MDTNKILNSDYLDILFEGRNKGYGSYELRRRYPERVRNAGIIVGVIIILLIAYPVIAALIPHKEVVIKKEPPKVANLTEPPPIDRTKPPPPPPPAAPPPPVKPTVQFTPPVIKKDEEVKEDEKPAKVEELKNAAAGVETKQGDPNGIDPGVIDNPGTGTGTVEAPPPPKIFTYVEQMPSFKNGDITSWLSSHVRYPDAEHEAGTQGRSIIKFVVNETGNISDVTIERSSGSSGLDAEAVRAVKSMPAWNPGKQNGTAVKVYFTLPITFQLD